MPVDSPDVPALQLFLQDAPQLLSRAQECVQHFRLVGEDSDASDCLIATLISLRQRAASVSQTQIAGFAARLVAVLEREGRRNCLRGTSQGILEACLSLLAWQVELTDPFSGPLDLDTSEQEELLEHLDHALSNHRSPANNS